MWFVITTIFLTEKLIPCSHSGVCLTMRHNCYSREGDHTKYSLHVHAYQVYRFHGLFLSVSNSSAVSFITALYELLPPHSVDSLVHQVKGGIHTV